MYSIYTTHPLYFSNLWYSVYSIDQGSSGTFSRSGLQPGRYRIRIEAIDDTTMQRTVIRRRFAVHGSKIHCSAVMINNGITVYESNVTAEFQGRGNATHFACILDKRKKMDPCKQREYGNYSIVQNSALMLIIIVRCTMLIFNDTLYLRCYDYNSLHM